MLRAVIGFSLFALFLGGAAQNAQFKVEGEVLDAANSPIPGADVTLS